MRKNHAIALLITVFTVGYAKSAASVTAHSAFKLCNSEYNNCVFDAGVKNNPHIDYGLGCDLGRTTGSIDVKTWKKCRDWCDAHYQKCNADVKEIFEE